MQMNQLNYKSSSSLFRSLFSSFYHYIYYKIFYCISILCGDCIAAFITVVCLFPFQWVAVELIPFLMEALHHFFQMVLRQKDWFWKIEQLSQKVTKLFDKIRWAGPFFIQFSGHTEKTRSGTKRERKWNWRMIWVHYQCNDSKGARKDLKTRSESILCVSLCFDRQAMILTGHDDQKLKQLAANWLNPICVSFLTFFEFSLSRSVRSGYANQNQISLEISPRHWNKNNNKSSDVIVSLPCAPFDRELTG